MTQKAKPHGPNDGRQRGRDQQFHQPQQQHRGPLPTALRPPTSATLPPNQQQRLQHHAGQAAPVIAHRQQQDHQAQLQQRRPAHLTDIAFSSLPLSSESQRALAEVLGFTHLTAVQHATLPAVLAGGDVMAKAKTGTGKTQAFLIPAVEQLIHSQPRPGNISVLVLSPTRELASQVQLDSLSHLIAKEAESLLTFHPYKAQVVYGGTNIKSELKRLQSGRCDVLVATPGRLIDHLQNSGLAPRLQSIRSLVLDEADQLLEMGFRPAIEKVLGFLPRERQTMLFSATMPQAVQQVAGLALRTNYAFIDTVGEEEADTNIQVDQSFCIVPMEAQLAAVLAVLRQQAKVPGHKVIAFFPTARLTQYMAELTNAAGIPALEIHSRKSQSAREKASAAFRSAHEAILFSSDVSARGVDYPDISLVLQVGLPSSREQYIHRLGRTARAGKRGQGLLMLAPYEKHFLRQLKDLPLEEAQAPAVSAADQAALAAAVANVDPKTAEMAYAAWLGFYNSAKGMGWDKPTLVQQANMFSGVLGLPEPPALLAKTIGMMGLRGVPGLRVASGAAGGGGGRGRGQPRGGGAGGARNGSRPDSGGNGAGGTARQSTGGGQGNSAGAGGSGKRSRSKSRGQAGAGRGNGGGRGRGSAW
ncbi:hypothetical protein N2152v2_010218 [Parachlorella kessleri]